MSIVEVRPNRRLASEKRNRAFRNSAKCLPPRTNILPVVAADDDQLVKARASGDHNHFLRPNMNQAESTSVCQRHLVTCVAPSLPVVATSTPFTARCPGVSSEALSSTVLVRPAFVADIYAGGAHWLGGWALAHAMRDSHAVPHCPSAPIVPANSC
jgi:hypothetical protein